MDFKLLNYIKKMFILYSLLLSIIKNNIIGNSIILQKKIYKKVFLDKKKINEYPRFISLKSKFKPSLKEIKKFNLLNSTIKKILI